MSQTTRNSIGECPACEEEAVDQGIEEFDGVCNTCGFVIHDATDPSPPEWIVSEDVSQETGLEEWLEYCPIRNASEQQLAQAFDALEQIADRLDVSIDLRQDAAEVYCDAHLAQTTDGRDTTTFVAACLRLASVQANTPLPQRRLTELPSVNTQAFTLSLTALHDDLDASPDTPRSADYIPFVATRLDMGETETTDTAQIVEDVEDEVALTGKDPASTTAACAYIATDSHTQAEVAEVVGVSAETIRLRVAQLRELMDHD